MIDKLKKYFPSLQYHSTIPSILEDQYRWYITDKSHVIGIHQDDLEAKDLMLLNTFLKPLKTLFPSMSEEEKKWDRWIHQNETISDLDVTYRFVYFEIPQKQIEPQAFKDAINQLFERDITILWENEQEGIIIEVQQDEMEESISYKQIIDILISDLYVKIKFFVGPYHTNLNEIKQHYEHLLSGARIAFSHAEHNVITYLEAIPYILMHQVDHTIKTEIQKIVLQDFVEDTEFLKMIEIFLESNLNISVAAKKLYMHRNSLQYRIDKFHEKTGIDVREFHQAMTVYLALLSSRG